MKKILLYSFIFSFLLIGCKKEEGEMLYPSDTDPLYSSSVLETTWENKLIFLSEDFQSIFDYVLVDDIILISTVDYFYAVSVQDGELMWSFNKKAQGFNILRDFSVNLIDNKLYIVNNQSCNSDIAVLDKTSGELHDRLIFSEIPGIEGSCNNAYIAGDQTFIATYKPNSHFGDYNNYSFYLYHYDLNSGSLELLYQDDLIYKELYTPQPVINYEKTHVYFTYKGVVIENEHEVRLIEVPVSGGEGKLVFARPLSGNHYLNTSPFVVKDQILVAALDLYGPYSILAYDLSNNGEIIWGEHRALSGNSILYPYVHLDELYLQMRDRRSNIQMRDLHNGEAIWNRNFFSIREDLNFLDEKPIGIIMSGGRISFLDLNVGSLLVVLNIDEISDIDGDYFPNTFTTIEEGNKIVVVTRRGQIVCYKLPF